VRRDSNQTQKECRPSEVFLGDARTGDPKIPEPSHRSGAVIEEMIALAKDMQRANERGATLKLNEAELAFYDALETNDSAVQVLGDETLRTIAR
jgi:type I site-specific restriction-modification system R (restriction) subunit